MSVMRQGMDLLLEISVPPVALPSAAGAGNGESDDEGVVLLLVAAAVYREMPKSHIPVGSGCSCQRLTMLLAASVGVRAQ